MLARVSRTLPVIISLAALAGSAAILLAEAPTVFGGHVIAHYMGHWTPVHGQVLGIAFAADPFGLLFALTVAVIGAILLLYTLSELGGLGRRELGGYACLFQLLLAALIGGALTADIIDLFVWFEVAALASYGLTGFFLERPIALEAAFKILVLTTLASFAIFIGAGLLYAETGALNYAQLHDALGAAPEHPGHGRARAARRRFRHQGRAGPVPRLARRRAHRRTGPGVRAVLRSHGQLRRRRDRPRGIPGLSGRAPRRSSACSWSSASSPPCLAR